MGGSFWKILLVVGTVLEAGTSANQQEPLQLKDENRILAISSLPGFGGGAMSYEDVVMTAVENYNRRHMKELPALLLKHVRPPQWDRFSDQKQMFNFTLKEVVCLKYGEYEPGDEPCSFKEDGTVLDCVGSYLITESPVVSFPTCNEVEDSSATGDSSATEDS